MPHPKNSNPRGGGESAAYQEQRGLVNILRRCLNELEGNQEMLSDQFQGFHYGVIMLGGYCNNSELTPQQRQQMYNVERANLVAARTMGANRFMATVLQQNRGSAAGGDDTDPATMEDDEGGESEHPRASDPPVAEVGGGQLVSLTQVHETLRGQLNAFLAREMWADAELVQQSIMVLLEQLNGAQTLQRGPRVQLIQRLGGRMEIIAGRQRQHGEVLVANRFQGFADQLRTGSRNGKTIGGDCVQSFVHWRWKNKMFEVEMCAVGTQLQGGVQNIWVCTHGSSHGHCTKDDTHKSVCSSVGFHIHSHVK